MSNRIVNAVGPEGNLFSFPQCARAACYTNIVFSTRKTTIVTDLCRNHFLSAAFESKVLSEALPHARTIAEEVEFSN